jgi:hypothetical protein
MTQTVTLTDVRAGQVKDLQAAIKAATESSKQAATDQASAEQAVKADEAALAQLRAQDLSLRQQFATADMKQEQHAIESELYKNLNKERDAGIKLADDQDHLAELTQQSQSLTGRLSALQAALAQAKADLKAAGQQDDATEKDRTALKTTVTDAVQEAGSDAVKAQLAAASDRLAGLVGGAAMVDVLRARYVHALAIDSDKQSAVARGQLAVSAVAQVTSPGPAKLDAAAAGHDDAKASVHRWATDGPGILASARQALQQTIGTADFSPAVSSDISDQAKAVTDSGAAAADKAFHDAAVASIAADAELDAVTGPKAAMDPTYDPAKDDTVKAQRAAADAAAKALTTAQAARTQDFQQQMIRWDLSLRPEAFPLAITTFGAQSQIAELAALNVTAALETLDGAETAHAGALKDQADISALGQAAAAEQAGREADAARYAAGADQRMLAVVRGEL